MMTAAQVAEMRISGRPPSMVPGRVASKLLGLEPADDAARERISIRMHWVHGATQGLLRAALGHAGPRGSAAAGTHFALVWTGDAMLYRGPGIAPWPWKWASRSLRGT